MDPETLQKILIDAAKRGGQLKPAPTTRQATITERITSETKKLS